MTRLSRKLRIIKQLTYLDKRCKRSKRERRRRNRKMRSRTFTMRRMEEERNQFNELTPSKRISFSFSLFLSIPSLRVAFFR